MALNKQIETRYGVPATYWRIVNMHSDFDRNQVMVSFGGYVTEQDRLDNKRPIETKGYNFEGSDKTREEVYLLIKASKMVQAREENGQLKVDAEGQPVMVESNPFTDAVDC